MKRQLAWILGGATVSMLAVGGTMIGCSNNSGGSDAGPDTGTAQDQSSPDVNNMNDTGTNDAGSDACKDNPDLHPTEAGTIFCGYDDAGNGFNCTTGNQCCLGGSTGSDTFAPEGCYAWGGVCPNPAPDGGNPIECEQTADCLANGSDAGPNVACCREGAGAPAVVMGCQAGDLKSSGGKGIFCEQGPTCTNSGALQICETNAECGDAGKVCTPMRWKIYEIGFCM
jgi:hypothetical protein